MGGGAYDVFLSYAHSDGAAATELNGWLVERGVSTFFDRNKLRLGIPWMTALEEAIGKLEGRRHPRRPAWDRQHPAI